MFTGNRPAFGGFGENKGLGLDHCCGGWSGLGSREKMIWKITEIADG